MKDGYTWRSRGEKTHPMSLWTSSEDAREIELLLPSTIDRDDPPMAVVVLAGGGYGQRTWHEGPGTALWLAMHGFAAVDVPYRTAEDMPGGEALGLRPLADACRAVRLVRDHADQFGLSPERVAVLGYSAGGHLAGSVAMLHEESNGTDDLANSWSGRPDAAVLIYPVVSMVPPCHDGSWRNLLGRNATIAERAERSLQSRVTSDAPPLFTVFAQDDSVVPIQGALELTRAYHDAGVAFEAHFYPTGGHGFGLGLDKGPGGVSNWGPLLVDWLRNATKAV
ncbi:MAG: alpha/beta hydrolase [Planctomycetota bacterium]